MNNLLKISAVFGILIMACSVVYYLVFFIPDKERQKLEIEKAKLEEQKRDKEKAEEIRLTEYTNKRKDECYQKFLSEKKLWNNVEGFGYVQINDTCVVRYTTDEYKGVDCAKVYKGIPSLEMDCRLGIFTKNF